MGQYFKTPVQQAGIEKDKKYIVVDGYRGDKSKTGLIVKLFEDDESECPFFVVVEERDTYYSVGEKLAIHAERLKPYEEDDMEMPKLEAGMVVELEYEGCSYGKFVYINDDWCLHIERHKWQDLGPEIEVIRVWRVKPTVLSRVESRLGAPIWERESSEERQKREQREGLEKKLAEAQALVAEVQGEIAKL